MPDTLTAPTETAPSLPTPVGSVVSAPDVASAPTPAKAPSIADATKAYLAALSPDAKTAPLAEPEPVEDTPESLAADLAFEPPVFDAATGKWRNKDGTFAEAPATDAPATETPAEAAPVEEAAPATEPETPAIRVELKDRNGNVVPIEVTDQQTAELLQANARDGLRRDEFNRRISSVEQREAELRAFETALRTNPDEVVLSRLSPDAQARIAVALIAQHWDAVYPSLEAMAADPSQRIVTATQAQLRQTQQQVEFQRVRAAEQRGVALESAVRSLVPESVDPETADRFLRDAVSDLTYHMQSRDVQPTDVAALLAPRVALYGFRADAPTGAAPNALSAVPSAPATGVPVSPAAAPAPAIPVARPVSVTAAPAASAGSVVSAARVAPPVDAATIARQQQQRARAAASAPAGAGAPPVSVRLPADATKSIEDASRYVRQHVGSW